MVINVSVKLDLWFKLIFNFLEYFVGGSRNQEGVGC